MPNVNLSPFSTSKLNYTKLMPLHSESIFLFKMIFGGISAYILKALTAKICHETELIIINHIG